MTQQMHDVYPDLVGKVQEPSKNKVGDLCW